MAQAEKRAGKLTRFQGRMKSFRSKMRGLIHFMSKKRRSRFQAVVR